jgi:hypothetical protein
MNFNKFQKVLIEINHDGQTIKAKKKKKEKKNKTSDYFSFVSNFYILSYLFSYGWRKVPFVSDGYPTKATATPNTGSHQILKHNLLRSVHQKETLEELFTTTTISAPLDALFDRIALGAT